jgi:hypothetical protein
MTKFVMGMGGWGQTLRSLMHVPLAPGLYEVHVMFPWELEPEWSFCIDFLSLSLSHTHTHTYKYTHTHKGMMWDNLVE